MLGVQNHYGCHLLEPSTFRSYLLKCSKGKEKLNFWGPKNNVGTKD
jgi:hypothetical protein